MGVNMYVRIGLMVKIDNVDIEHQTLELVNGCQKCETEDKNTFCSKCGSKNTQYEKNVTHTIDSVQELLWEIGAEIPGFEDSFYSPGDLENVAIPNFNTEYTIEFDDYTNTNVYVIPSDEERQELIDTIKQDKRYKVMKYFCEKRGINCDLFYGAVSYWS